MGIIRGAIKLSMLCAAFYAGSFANDLRHYNNRQDMYNVLQDSSIESRIESLLKENPDDLAKSLYKIKEKYDSLEGYR